MVFHQEMAKLRISRSEDTFIAFCQTISALIEFEIITGQYPGAICSWEKCSTPLAMAGRARLRRTACSRTTARGLELAIFLAATW